MTGRLFGLKTLKFSNYREKLIGPGVHVAKSSCSHCHRALGGGGSGTNFQTNGEGQGQITQVNQPSFEVSREGTSQTVSLGILNMSFEPMVMTA